VNLKKEIFKNESGEIFAERVVGVTKGSTMYLNGKRYKIIEIIEENEKETVYSCIEIKGRIDG
jgi:hypothetical protein